MTEIVAAVIGAIVGFIAGIFTEWWKSDRDDVIQLCRGFCDLVSEAMGAGARFWLSDGAHPDTELLSIQLLSFQTRIDGYREILLGRIDNPSMDNLVGVLSSFYSVLTGGDFEDPARKGTKLIAVQVQDAGSEVINSVRRAAFVKVNLIAAFFTFLATSFPNKPVWQSRRIP